MKIVHLCLTIPYSDNYSYQENMLPKHHKEDGYEVEIIASRQIFNDKGKLVIYDGVAEYENEYGIKITRVDYKKPVGIYTILRRYKNVIGALEKANPDILFIHGCQFLDMDKVVRFLKHRRDIKVYVDNHADFQNSARNWLSEKIKHGIIWRRSARLIEPYTEKFYGVLPARVEFLKDVYKLPPKKCELLVMGADDDEVRKASDPSVRTAKRKEYGVSEADILIVAGGKIDYNKHQILLLMQAVNEIADKHIRLNVFGSVSPELKESFYKQISEYVKHIGWKTSSEIYSEFATADIVAFPGLHSVLWEQAVGMGKPCIFRRIDGFNHIDLGGNCVYFEKDSTADYISSVKEAINNLDRMKNVAEEYGKEAFSYNSIAKKSLGK